MSVVGIGVDVTDVARIEVLLERWGDRFVGRFARPGEVRVVGGPGRPAHVAGIFAAKEAVLKALGTGWAQGLGLRQVEVVRDEHGRPGVRLHDAARARARQLGVEVVHLSISHERTHAVAFAVAESRP